MSVPQIHPFLEPRAAPELVQCHERDARSFYELYRGELIGLLPLMHEAQETTRALAQELASRNAALVPFTIREYGLAYPGFDYFDIISFGNEGLMNAVYTFDYRWGNRFSTYAVTCIRNRISREVDQNKSLIKVPIRAQQQHVRRRVQHLHDPTRVQHLYDPTIIIDPMSAVSSGSHLRLAIDAVIQTLLSLREQEIIKNRYGFEEKTSTYEELGARFHVTREHARQIEVRALQRLQIGNRRMSLSNALENFYLHNATMPGILGYHE